MLKDIKMENGRAIFHLEPEAPSSCCLSTDRFPLSKPLKCYTCLILLLVSHQTFSFLPADCELLQVRDEFYTLHPQRAAPEDMEEVLVERLREKEGKMEMSKSAAFLSSITTSDFRR